MSNLYRDFATEFDCNERAARKVVDAAIKIKSGSNFDLWDFIMRDDLTATLGRRMGTPITPMAERAMAESLTRKIMNFLDAKLK